MKKLMTAALIGFAAFAAVAEDGMVDRPWAWSPLGVGIAAPIQLPLMSTDIYGLRLGGFFSRNYNVYGIDLGVVGMNNGDMDGIQANVFNWSSRDVTGIQIGALANVVHGSFGGIQLGAFNMVYTEPTLGIQLGGILNYDISFAGIQFGALNWDTTYFYGWQAAGLANVVREDAVGFAVAPINCMNRFVGFQLGAVNVADECVGLQIGVFNGVNKLSGLQIGVLNLICADPLLNVPVLPVANASF